MLEYFQDLELWQAAGLGAFGMALVSLAVGYGFVALRSSSDEGDSPLPDIDEEMLVEDGGRYIEVPPPVERDQTLVSRLYKLYKHNKNKRKIGGEGYVQWILIDDTVSEPKWIKPELKGGGIPEYEYEGETYLFPPEAMRPDRQTGTWVCMHHRHDAMPVNLKEPGEPSISTDELKEFLAQRVTSSPPSWLDTIDMDAQTILKFAIVGFIVLVLGQAFIGGLF